MISILQSAYPAKFAFASHHVSKRPWKLSKAARSCWLWVALSCTIAFILFSISVQAQRSLMTRHVREATLNRQAQPLGHLPATQAMRLNIVLTLRDEAELNAFLDELYDPASPSYRHFLSVAEFTARFGPTQENYEAVVAFAAAKGLAVVGGTRDGMDVQVEGSVSAIEAAFRINLQTYQHPTENRVFYAPDREPTVDLPFQLWHISGLDNYSIPHTMLVSKSDYAQAHSISPEAVVSHATTGSGPSASFLGSDMRAAYYGGTTLTGAGQNLGLLEFLGTNLADLNTYFTNVGQTNNVPVTLLSTDGTSTTCLYSSGCSDTEQTLDMTQALGMAPGLSSLVMYIGSSDTAIVSAMTTHNPLPTAIGCSWGWTPADPSALDPYFKRMAAQGQNFFAASGDDSTWSSVNEAWPSDDVNVVSVGGTDLITASAGGAWEWETAWLDSGGGISPDGIAIPAWQKLMGVINSSNLGSTTLRNGPDVSANANFTFYTCSNQTTCLANEYGGTSFAAPMWAGYVALLNQQLAANDEPSIGFLNPTIYAQNVTSIYDTDFHDITSGTSGSYSAASGYDLVTGWGSPNGQNLINALAGSPASGFTLSASPSSLSVNPGGTSTTTITINGLAGFTGSVSLAVTSDLPSGVTASFSPNPTTGTSVLTLTASSATAASTYGVTVIGTSGDLAETTGISLTVVNSPEITAPPPTNFGPVGIGTASPSVPSIFTFDKSVTLGSTAVLTQGATGLDFADAGSDTCTANTAYAAGQTCTVNVTFTPKFAGTRYGAVVIYDNNGNAIATGYLQGSGVGPQITFQPGEQSTLGSGFSAPMGVAVDGSSNVYVADSENGAVKEILAVNGSIPVSPIINVLGSGFNTPMGVAVDGNGNVFVADYGASSVYEILRAGDYTTVNKLGDGFSNPRGVAVDGSGNVFVADWGNNAVKEIPLGCVESSCVATLGSGFEYPGGVAVDGSDNVFVIDGGSSTVKEILAAGDYGTVNTLAIGMILASNIAVDGVGNLFVAGQNLDTSIYTVLEIVAAGGYTTADALGGSFSFPYDVAVDGVGNVYVADTSNNRIEKMDYADAPSLNFAGTVVGSTSTDSPQTVTVQNVGNAALSFPIPSSGNNPTIATNFTQNSSGASACPLVSAGSSTAGMLAAGASCQLRISFAPAAAGTLTGSLALTDNNLNAAAPAYTKQSITLSGTGTQATPAITWAAPAAITYSTPLSTTQLNATSTVAGSFTYLPAAGTVLIAGQQTLTATFAPTDATDYTTASATVPLTVIPATATVTLSNLSQTYSGSPITATVTTNPAALAVNVTYNGSSIAPTAVGSYTVVATVNDPNYTGSATGTLTINPAIGAVTLSATTVNFAYIALNTPSTVHTITLTNSQSTPLVINSLTLSGSGEFALAPASTTCPSSGTLAAKASCTIGMIFTPTALGAVSGSLAIIDNASNSPQTVALSGTGLAQTVISATAVNFAYIALDTTSTVHTISLTNNLAVALDISSLALSGSGEFALDPSSTCPASGTVPANSTCKIGLTFAPTALGAVSGTLTISTNAINSPLTVALSGTGLAQTVISGTSANFGNVAIGTTSAAATFTFTNNLAVGLNLSLAFSNSEFALVAGSTTCPSTVPNNSSCKIGFAFTPSATGAQSGTLTITDSANTSPQIITLSGTGVVQTSISATALNFATVLTGATSAVQSVTLTNNLTVALNVSLALSNSEFALATASTTCPSSGTIPANSTCRIGLTFAPTAAGTQSGTLTISTSANNSPLTVALSGSGLIPTVVSATTVSFGYAAVNTTTTVRTITLTNNQSVALNISSLAFSNSEFALDPSTTCPNSGTIPANSTCKIGLTFTPTELGAQSGTLTISTSATNSPLTVTLSGSGLAQTVLSATAVNFAYIAIDTTSTVHTITLTNNLPAGLGITSLALAGSSEFALDPSTTCSGTVAANSTCKIGLTFAPMALGAVTGTLTINTSANNSPLTVTLSGTGLAQSVVSVTAVNFGYATLNTTSNVATITLTNNLAVGLNISSLAFSNSEFALDPSTTCSSPIPANSSCKIGLTFTPTALGAQSGTLTISTGANNSPLTVTLSGSGLQPSSGGGGPVS